MAKGFMETSEKSLLGWALVVSVLAIAAADPRINDFDNENQVSINKVEYQYRYAIDESKNKGPVMDRWEQRIGEYVKGAYSVVEPDGRVRTVDYEVDGKKGYHAVIRMNEPGPDLLSYQQLQKSFEYYPEPVLPAQVEIPSRNLSPPDPSTGKAWNYHSEARYANGQSGSKPEESKHVEKTPIPKALPTPRALENLPLSPANFNVPQTTNVVYYETPVAAIFQTFHPVKPDNYILNDIKPKTLFAPVVSNGSKNVQPRQRRHSTLVRRYKSFTEVVS